jgi:hypothetical protein
VKTKPRQRPDNVKEAVVVARQFENQRLRSEEVAEFNYQPTACTKTYRMVVIKKNISVEKGEKLLFDQVVYFFYITNDGVSEADAIVFSANDRCDQENLLAQLHGGVRALHAPVDNLDSNGAYMVMTALAWNLKAWWALRLPEQPGRWQERHQTEKRWVLRLEFKTFVNAFVRLPCQIIRTGRKQVYRLLGWNPYQPIFFRVVDVLCCCSGQACSRSPDAPIPAGLKRNPAERGVSHAIVPMGTTCTGSRKAERTKYAVDDKGPAALPTSESSLV